MALVTGPMRMTSVHMLCDVHDNLMTRERRGEYCDDNMHLAARWPGVGLGLGAWCTEPCDFLCRSQTRRHCSNRMYHECADDQLGRAQTQRHCSGSASPCTLWATASSAPCRPSTPSTCFRRSTGASASACSAAPATSVRVAQGSTRLTSQSQEA